MKWVWNRDKTVAINLDRASDIQIHKSSWEYEVMVDDIKLDNIAATLATFPTLEAAQKFVNGITGAVNGGTL